MKIILSLILLFLPGLSIHNAKKQESVKLSTFKDVPEELMGCGDNCYLNGKDKTHNILICRTDYSIAFIHLNNRSIRLQADDKVSHHKNEEIYINGQYILSLQKIFNNQVDSEDYDFSGLITIRLGSRIIYQQKVIGEGGC